MQSADYSIHLLYLIILVILLVVLALIAAVLFISFLKFKGSKQSKIWSTIIDEQLTDAIVFGADNVNNTVEFANHLTDKNFRELFLEKLVESDKKFKGEAQQEIKNLFHEYHLEEVALDRLNQKKEYLIAGGIQELSSMHIENAHSKIETFLQHPSRHVYQEAQYAVVIFRGFNGLAFLDKFTLQLSEWQQLRLLMSVNVLPADSSPKVIEWLNSSNDYVVIFALRLIRKFQILGLYDEVHQLLNHPSTDVKVQVIQTLLKIENSFTTQHFIEAFPHQPFRVQTEILKMFKNSKDRSSEDFIKEQMFNSISTEIRIFAAEVMVCLDQHEYLRKVAQCEETSEQLKAIINHALQEKIC